jgi:hypothetical protein
MTFSANRLFNFLINREEWPIQRLIDVISGHCNSVLMHYQLYKQHFLTKNQADFHC